MQAETSPRPRLIVGTRTSNLARWQSEFVINLLQKAWPDLQCALRPFQTKGDRTLDRPLPEIGGKGLFTAELERALLAGEIDIAVHSLKDLPVDNPPGLTIGAIPPREEVNDLLVARDGATMTTLAPGAVVGTSSLRRQAQILAVRPDLLVRSIRGNVETRMRKVHEGDYDAAVLAVAGLRRLDLDHDEEAILPLDLMLPAPGQGALAVQCRAGDAQTLALLKAIDDPGARQATTAERRFLQAMGGGCSAPIAAHAVQRNGEWEMEALVASPNGGALIRVSARGRDPISLAVELAAQAREQGADNIISALRAAPEAPTAAATRALPLDGVRVVVTRAKEQAPELAGKLQQQGAQPILFPTIRIAPFDDSAELDEAIRSLPQFDWVIFTSVNGVTLFFEQMKALGLTPTHFAGVRVAAIGPATAGALRARQVEADFVPAEYVAERIAEGLGNVSGSRILLPRAEQARTALTEQLRAGGALVTEVASYRTLPETLEEGAARALEVADVFTFTSASTVKNFVALIGGRSQALALAENNLVACIGPITAAAARKLGLEPQIIAADYTMDGLVAALVAHFETHPLSTDESLERITHESQE